MEHADGIIKKQKVEISKGYELLVEEEEVAHKIMESQGYGQSVIKDKLEKLGG